MDTRKEMIGTAKSISKAKFLSLTPTSCLQAKAESPTTKTVVSSEIALLGFLASHLELFGFSTPTNAGTASLGNCSLGHSQSCTQYDSATVKKQKGRRTAAAMPFLPLPKACLQLLLAWILPSDAECEIPDFLRAERALEARFQKLKFAVAKALRSNDLEAAAQYILEIWEMLDEQIGGGKRL